MKFFIAFALLVAGVSAMPESLNSVADQRLVSDLIISAIEDVSQSIKDAGLDPLVIRRESANYALPVPVIFGVAATVENILSTGLSNIVINNISFGIITFRLTFDIELPLITASVDSSSVDAVLFGKDYNADFSGSLAIQRIRFRGSATVSRNVLGGISIRSFVINFTLDGISSNLNLSLLGTNYSNALNTFLGVTIPETLIAFRTDIDELLRIVILDFIEENL